MVQILPRIKSTGESIAEALGGGIGEGLQQVLHNFVENQRQKKTGQYFSELAGKHPDDPKYQMLSDIYSSPMPGEHKSALVKALIGSSDPYRALQQERLTKDSISSQYNRAIGEIDNGIKNGVYGFLGPKYDQAQQRREQLVQQRDNLLGLLKQSEGEPKEDKDYAAYEKEFPVTKPKKAKFSKANPEHMKKFNFLVKRHGKDQKKIRKILEREFDLD